jgi:lysozyme
MKTSAVGIASIRHHEGCLLEAYQDSGGVWTIGVGHTGDVRQGQKLSQAQADALLAKDLTRFEVVVNTAVTLALSQGQFDALVSLAFNIGSDAFTRSTLVRKLNAGDIAGAGGQFIVWHMDNGAVNKALLSRRAAELWMFAMGSA